MTAHSDYGSKITRLLFDNYPKKIDFDYNELSGVSQSDKILSPVGEEAFHQIEAFTSLLFSRGLMEADRYFEGRYTFFWNAILSFEAYSALRQHTIGGRDLEGDSLLTLIEVDRLVKLRLS